MDYFIIKKGKLFKLCSKSPIMLSDEFFWKIRYIFTHKKNPSIPFLEYKYKF